MLDVSTDLSTLASRDLGHDELFGIRSRPRYPIKMLRYLFMASFVNAARERAGAPIRVCEIGVDRGQMLHFYRHYLKSKTGRNEESASFSAWDAVTYTIREEALRRAGYTAWRQADVETPNFMGSERYDVIILCHLLEHLREPEVVVKAVADNLRPGGVVVGGTPVTPHFAAHHRQVQIRKRASPFGHVSVFSPQRVRAMALQARLECEVVTGAYFMRNNGSRLENLEPWARANLAFGRRFPWWPGEIYWQMRRA